MGGTSVWRPGCLLIENNCPLKLKKLKCYGTAFRAYKITVLISVYFRKGMVIAYTELGELF